MKRRATVFLGLQRWVPAALAALAMVPMASCSKGEPTPVEVPPADEGEEPVGTDNAEAEADRAKLPDQWRPGAGSGSAVWVVDVGGDPVGVLVRRGSDDTLADRAIYDIVTVYDPESGLFFEMTMSDGVVRYPGTTFFKSANCDIPVGVTSGGCPDCRSGYGTAFLHNGIWWRVEGGVLFEMAANGSSIGGGLSTTCVAHGSSNTKVFPVEQVSGPTPPTSFDPPLRFSWR